MSELLGNRWLCLHAMVAPFGVTAAMALLVYITEPVEQDFSQFVHAAGGLVDLGAVVYAGAAVLAERGGTMIWWSLEQWKKYREQRIAHIERLRSKLREEDREEGRAEGLTEGRAEAVTAILEAARSDADEEVAELIERLARGRGILPDDTPPHNGASG